MQERALRKPALLSLLSFSLALLVFMSGLLDTFELKAYDFLSRHLNPASISNDILIVAIDQRSIDALAKQDVSWPWPRQVYAPITEYLSGADAVYIDILYTENSSYGVEDDKLFGDAIKKAGNVFLPVFVTDNKTDLSSYEKELADKISLKENLPVYGRYRSIIAPLDIISSGAAGHGNVMIRPDEDGIYRRVPLFFQAGQYVIPHFVLPYLFNRKMITAGNSGLTINNKSLLLSDNTLLLRYSSHSEPFRTIPATDIIQAYLDSSSGKKPLLSKDFFRNRKVFIGLTAPGLYDLKPTAITPVSTGVHINATALENLINRNFITAAGDLPVFIFMLIISVMVTVSVLRYHSMAVSFAVMSAAIIITIAVPAVLFRNTFYLKAIPPLLSAVLSFATAAAYSYAVEGKQRRFIKKTFSQYMDRTIVEYLLKNPEMIQPGGRKMRVTVFFADIAGFTTLAEQLLPEESARILNSIFNAFTEVIIKNQGVIDKYIGDCVMAFWGAPLQTDQDEESACRAAIQCMESLQELNRSFVSKGLPEISMRIGIHTGDAIVGNLGSDRLFDFTVVGDTVNLASRLESINKVFKTGIIISEATRAEVGQEFLLRDLGRIEVKGKTKPVAIFEVAGKMDAIDESVSRTCAGYNEGLKYFRNSEWGKAMEIFSQMPKDGPSTFYLERCRLMLNAGALTDGWDIIKMTEK